MEYSIRQLSELAGISARTLRYYDSIGLLKPSCVRDSGYRYYGEKEVELLQQILFYKERGLKLEQIAEIVKNGEFDIMTALDEHLQELVRERDRMNHMITAVKKTIASMKGEITMSDKEKFEAFKKEMIKKNEEQYGDEVRRKYGDREADESNRKLVDMSEEEYRHMQTLEKEIKECLKAAVKAGEGPESDAGKKVVQMHKEWLVMTWRHYSADAHKGVAQMYREDERFRQYYDSEVVGCAQLLRDAVDIWAGQI